MHPFEATAGLYHLVTEGNYHFVGTCFLYQHGTTFLTAAHCVPKDPAARLMVFSPFEQIMRLVDNIVVHESADVAVLKTQPNNSDKLRPFGYHISNYDPDEDVGACGFPEDALGPNQGLPLLRVFKGHFLRLMTHASEHGYQYDAAEVSFACPSGLSGGPVYRLLEKANVLIGIITENIEVSTEWQAIEEEQELGSRRRVETHRVVQYGIALLLNEIDAWLTEHTRT